MQFTNYLYFSFYLIPGGCCGSTRKQTIVGGWAWAWWWVTDVQRLSLEVMTLNPMCENVETSQGVPLTVTGVAQCKIMKVRSIGHAKIRPHTLTHTHTTFFYFSSL